MRLIEYLNLCADEDVMVYDSELDIDCCICDMACEMGCLLESLDRVCEIVRIKDGSPFINLYEVLGCDNDQLSEVIRRHFPGVYDQEDFEDGYAYFVDNLFEAINNYDADEMMTFMDVLDEVIDRGLVL